MVGWLVGWLVGLKMIALSCARLFAHLQARDATAAGRTLAHAQTVEEGRLLKRHGVVTGFKYFDARAVLRSIQRAKHAGLKRNKRSRVKEGQSELNARARSGITFGLKESWHIVAVANVPLPSTRTNNHRPFSSCTESRCERKSAGKRQTSSLAAHRCKGHEFKRGVVGRLHGGLHHRQPKLRRRCRRARLVPSC